MLTLLAVAIALTSVLLAWAQAKRTASPPAAERAKLATRLKARPLPERLEALSVEAHQESWEASLAREVMAAPLAARPAVVNLALSEIDHMLVAGEGWPRAAVRISLLGGALVAFTAYLMGASIARAMTDVGIGVGAALACYEAGRVATTNVRRQREAIDLLVSTVFGDGAEPTEVGDGRHASNATTWSRRSRRPRRA